MKVSDYLIIRKHALKDCYIAINSLSGNVDYISNQVGKKLSHRDLEGITKVQSDYLLDRGYLIEKSTDELKRLNDISQLIHNKNLNKKRLSIAPTLSCNFACSYCFEGLNKNNSKTLDISDVDEIFNAVDHSLLPFDKNVFLFGGEPLMRKNKKLLCYIVKKCQERGMKLYGTTNGYDLNFYEDLLDDNKINNLQVTIDGVKEIHNSSRKHINGLETFDKIVSNIDYCLKNKVKIIARTNLSRNTVQTAVDLLEFYEDKGWISNKNFTYSFSPIVFCKDSLSYPELFEELKKIGLPEKLLVLHVSQYIGITKKLLSLIEREHLVIFQPEGCSACYNSFIVAPDKNLYTCGDLMNTNMSCGKLIEGSFKFNKLQDEWNSRYIVNMDKCPKCAYALYCGGSCAAICIRKKKSIYTSLCNSFPEVFDKCLSNICSEKIPCKI